MAIKTAENTGAPAAGGMEKKFDKGGERGERKYGGKRDRDGDDKDGGGKGSWRRRERPPVDLIIDYKDIDTLRPFIAEGGRIVPARVNRLNRKQQRELMSHVKRARQLALVPVSDRHTSR